MTQVTDAIRNTAADHTKAFWVADAIRHGDCDHDPFVQDLAALCEQAVQEAMAERDARIGELEAENVRLRSENSFFAGAAVDFHRVCNANRVHDEVLISAEVTSAFNRLYAHVSNLARAALQEIDNG